MTMNVNELAAFGSKENDAYLSALSPAQLQMYKDARPEMFGYAQKPAGMAQSEWDANQDYNNNFDAYTVANRQWQADPNRGAMPEMQNYSGLGRRDWNDVTQNPYLKGMQQQYAQPKPQQQQQRQVPQNNTQPFQQTQAYQSAMSNQYQTQPSQQIQNPFQSQYQQPQYQPSQIQQFQPQGLLNDSPAPNQNRYGLLSAYGSR